MYRSLSLSGDIIMFMYCINPKFYRILKLRWQWYRFSDTHPTIFDLVGSPKKSWLRLTPDNLKDFCRTVLLRDKSKYTDIVFWIMIPFLYVPFFFKLIFLIYLSFYFTSLSRFLWLSWPMNASCLVHLLQQGI